MKSPVVSLIMPAYNAAAYIEKSAGSVLRQTMADLELIIIDDGSGDGTAAVLAALAEKDSRVRFFTVENGGPAKARNYGLSKVSPGSRYIGFIDSDDELLPDALEYALQSGGEAEIIIHGFSIVGADGSERHYFEEAFSADVYSLGRQFAALYKANLLNQVWGKLYKRELIADNNILFPDYRWGEDRLFVFDCLDRAEKIAVLPGCKYRYIMHEGESLITRFYDKKAEVCLRIDKRAAELCRKFGVEDESWFRCMFAKSIFSCFTNLFSPSCRLTRQEKLGYIRSVLSDGYVARRCVKPAGGLPVRVLSAVLRSGSAALNLFVFRMVALAGRLTPKLFMALKHRK